MKVEAQLPLGKVDPGLRSTPKLDLFSVQNGAREIEAMGFDGMTTGEIKTDPFIPLALGATTTERITLTPTVAIAFARSPTLTAMIAWDIQTLSRGRFILGLGTQVKGHIERRYGMPWHPAMAHLREYVLAIRAVWDCWQNGGPLKFDGEYYKLSLMVPLFNPGPIPHPNIPIQVAAVNKLMCQLAGEVCDGIRPHPITTPKYITEVMLPNVTVGADRVRRRLEDFQVAISPLVGVADSDEELATRLDDIRARIAFYASTRTYRPVFEAHGWGGLVDELHQLSVKQRWDEMPKRVSDEVVETIAVVGTHDNIADKIHARYGRFATRIKFSLPIQTPADRERLCSVVRQLQRRSVGD